MALSADTNLVYEIGPINTLPLYASAVVYKGSAMGLSSGYARPLTAGDVFCGFADAAISNSTGTYGAKTADVITEGALQVTLSGITATGVGWPVYMSDDNTFTLTEATNSLIGFVHRYVTTNTCVVRFKVKETLGAVEATTLSATVVPGQAYEIYGFKTAAQLNSVVAAVNAIVAFLNGK